MELEILDTDAGAQRNQDREHAGDSFQQVIQQSSKPASSGFDSPEGAMQAAGGSGQKLLGPGDAASAGLLVGLVMLPGLLIPDINPNIFKPPGMDMH
jgi:hypothetical protein